MKLKNLFFATMAFGLLTACSNDDDVNGPATQGEVDASISFVATANDLTTKATSDAEAVSSEAFINKLDMYVFNQAGALVATKSVAASGNTSLTQIGHVTVKVTAGATLATATADKFTAYILANCNTLTSNTLSAFEAEKAALGIESYTYGTTNLPMAKKVTFTGLVPLKQSESSYVENWVGTSNETTGFAPTVPTTATTDAGNTTAPSAGYSPVVLKRLIARIQVESVQIDLSQNYATDATFKLTALALANVHTDATVLGTVKTKGVWAKGYQSANYVLSDKVVAPYSVSPYNIAIPTLVKSYTFDAMNSGSLNFTDKKFFAYAFPNDGTDTFVSSIGTTAIGNTVLLIAGQFKAPKATTSELRHFRVPISHNGINKIEANTVYKLTIKITGEGSPNEDELKLNAHVSAQVTVAPWNVINQTEEDVN